MSLGLGRRSRLVDTRPGKVLALALLANAPILIGFILAPILARGDATTARAAVPYVLLATPLLAAASLLVFARSPHEARRHRASRIGVVLAATSLLLWALVAALSL